uniref:Archaeosortase A n=1 Tax=Geoglobus ahangari TaxID=113653 RepID=A0A7C3YF94_9EURY
MFVFVVIAIMILYVLTRLRIVGFLSWLLFALIWLEKIPYYLSIYDYYNTSIMFLAFVFFTLIALTILKSGSVVFVMVTILAAVSSLIYFLFTIPLLKDMLIKHTIFMTVNLANSLGFEFTSSDNFIYYNGRRVEIILACTGIESMALFSAILFSVNAEIRRRIAAFLISVPVIYVLNLLRNIFIVAAFGENWFGENSFYVAHHVISKVLATFALILISLGVFKILPEVADMIVNLKNELVRTWRKSD